jgi:hypothetical protein
MTEIQTKRDFMAHPKVAEMRAKVWTRDSSRPLVSPYRVREGVVAEYPTVLMAMAAAAELYEAVNVPLMVAYGPGNRHGQYTMFIVSPFEFFTRNGLGYWECYPSHRDMIQFLEKHGLCPW